VVEEKPTEGIHSSTLTPVQEVASIRSEEDDDEAEEQANISANHVAEGDRNEDDDEETAEQSINLVGLHITTSPHPFPTAPQGS
jgi:hypothetical protein